MVMFDRRAADDGDSGHDSSGVEHGLAGGVRLHVQLSGAASAECRHLAHGR